jgi:hypothetical protein
MTPVLDLSGAEEVPQALDLTDAVEVAPPAPMLDLSDAVEVAAPVAPLQPIAP